VEQLRIVSRLTLPGLFGAALNDETMPLVRQALTVGDALWAFIENQERTWGAPGALGGAMGGDGDWAKESLGYGFMVENAYFGVYRIWGRAWLVTK
jgi:hypothetical protein